MEGESVHQHSCWEGRNLVESGRAQEGIRVLESAARSGDAEAAVYLGFVLARGEGGVSPEVEAARYWLLHAASLGSSEAAFQLGLLDREAGRVQDAFVSFKKAYELGHVAAAQRLGYLCTHAEGFSDQQLELGISAMRWAAERGHAFAMRDYSIILFSGKYRKRELLGAIKFRIASLLALLRLASRDGNHELIR
jgi:TPR repeat protein